MASGQGQKVSLFVDFYERAYAELVLMERDLQAQSKGQIIAEGLGALKWLAGKVDDEGKIIILRDGKKIEATFPFLKKR